MCGELTHEISHLTGIGIPLLLGPERRTVLKPKKHLSDLIFVCAVNQDDIERIRIQADSKLVRQSFVLAVGDGISVDRICVARKAVSTREEFPDGAQSLLTVDHVVCVRLLTRATPVEFWNIIIPEDRIN